MESCYLSDIVFKINKYVKLKHTIIGIKFFEKEADLESIERIRIPDKNHSVCQMFAQSIAFGWTIGIKKNNVFLDYCKTINGLMEKDERFTSGKMFANYWCGSEKAAKVHHTALDCVPPKYEAIAVSPIESNRIPNPDVCLIYATPGQIFMMLSGLIRDDYKKLNFTFMGESTCSDSWVKTFLTEEPGLSISCFAERKFGGVSDDQMLITVTLKDLIKMAKGLEGLHKVGLRYPIAAYSITTDIKAGLPPHYYDY